MRQSLSRFVNAEAEQDLGMDGRKEESSLYTSYERPLRALSNIAAAWGDASRRRHIGMLQREVCSQLVANVDLERDDWTPLVAGFNSTPDR